MFRSAIVRMLPGLCLLLATSDLPAGDVSPAETTALANVTKILQKPALPAGQALQEMQAYCRANLVPIPRAKTVAEWESYTTKLRQQIFDQVIFRGEAAGWKDLPTEPIWFETIAGGPGYSLKKLRYEAVPGMWIPAILYVPDKLEGKVPVVLAVNGHDRNGKSADYKQARCINLVKRGMIVLNLEWINMGQLRSRDFDHGAMNQLDLCGTSGIAPFYLSMKRGLDILLAQPHADSKRVAVSGLSGGGWQTIFISSLDTRVTLCNPVAGYSGLATRIDHAKDLGDSEQTPADLATYADYTHLTALLAPRPALLTYNAKDECCFEAGYALKPLVDAAQPIYELYGKQDHLRTHINKDPGTHNYLKENREAYYKLIGDFFYPGDKSYIYPELPYESELKTAAQLNVILPEPNAGFNTLALQLAKNLPRQGKLPSVDAAAVKKWQGARAVALETYFKAPRIPANVQFDSRNDKDEYTDLSVTMTDGKRISVMTSSEWTYVASRNGKKTGPLILSFPSTMVSRWQDANGTRINTYILADKSRQSSADLLLASLRNNETPILMDPPGVGESDIPTHGWLFDLILASHSQSPLKLKSSLLVQALGNRDPDKTGKVKLVARGPRTSLLMLATAARLCATGKSKLLESIELHDCPGSLKEILEKNLPVQEARDLYSFGLLEEFDIPQLAALCAPVPVTFVKPSERARKELDSLRGVYQAFGSKHEPLSK